MTSPRTDDITSAEREVRRRLGAGDDRAAGLALRQLADSFAADPALRDQALLLNLDLEAVDESLRLERRQEMLDLLERIVIDHVRHDGVHARQERDRALGLLREHLLRRAPAEDRAFEGRGLCKTWSREFQLSPFDLTLRLGQVTGVVGQNAHGKTTLLRIVAGELRSDDGSQAYPLLGERSPAIDWVHVKRHVAFVPQELPAWRGSLRDTLHFEAAMHGVLGQDNEREVRFVVERLDLTEHLDKRWGQLSGGTRLRFALARALVWKPRLLVMDEPLANLDVQAKNVLLQDVRDLAASYRYPIAVLMSSHELYALERVCQQMVFLRDGKVVYAGQPEDVGAQLDFSSFELGTDLGLAALRQALDGSVVLEVQEDGVNFMLRTDRRVGHREVLQLLLDRGIDIQHFRDNTHSVRRLFN